MAEYQWGDVDSLVPSQRQRLKFRREPDWALFEEVDPTVCAELGRVAAAWENMDTSLVQSDRTARGISWTTWEEMQSWPTDYKVALPLWDGTL